MKKFLSLFLLITVKIYSQNFRDSIDVLHYTINLEISIEEKFIKGWTEITFKPKIAPLKIIKFDLLGLKVSKIDYHNLHSWKQNDSLIIINPKKQIQKNQKQTIKIFYSGHPIMDKFWGGFYFKDKNAFNFGVAMESIPHPFGRVWFPAIDNFTDKAFYDFFITVKKPYVAVCGGLLKEVKQNKNYTTYHWQLNRLIPTYLASVNVGIYDTLSWTYNGIKRKIPVIIYVFPEDKILAKQTLSNLDSALSIFENLYGEYKWERVGYTEVLFSGGAMEHAENIAIPRLAFDGTKKNETLIYHELSHHWFGNLVTCSTPQDMWLNEGWATYNESIFTQYVYGDSAFKENVRARHFYTLNFAHKNDKGYRSVANMNQKYTYGTTVYKKGADVVHTLRYYLGDSIFFPAVKQYLNTYSFKSASSYDLMNFLSDYTKTNLKDFFDFWVFTKGFPFFQLYKWQIIDSSENYFLVKVIVKQRAIGTDKLANSNRIPIAFFDKKLNRTNKILFFSGQIGIDTFKINFKPIYVALDIDEHIADATTDQFYIIDKPQNLEFDHELSEIIIQKIPYKAIIRLQANWIEPDNIQKKYGYLFQKNFYWTVEGSFDSSTKGKIRFYLTSLMDMNFKYLHNPKEFVLFYRKNPYSDWQLVDFQLKENYVGQFIETDLKKGDFALAVKIYE